MVRRDQNARHGSTESSGADTVKDGVGGNAYNGDSFMNPLRDRFVYLFLLHTSVRDRDHLLHSDSPSQGFTLPYSSTAYHPRLSSAFGIHDPYGQQPWR